MNQKLLLRLVISAVVIILASCSAPATPPQPIQPSTATQAIPPTATRPAVPATPVTDTFIIAHAQDLTALDPHQSTSSADVNYQFNVFDTLVIRGPDMKLQPNVATEWKAINDTTWQFKLRKDVKFHNGEPLNANAVKFTFDRELDPNEKALTASAVNIISKVDVVDDYTVNIITKSPDPLLPARLAFYGGSLIPPKYWKEIGGAQAFAKKPVGSGPYKFVEYVKDDRLVLERNDDYWGTKPAWKRLIFRPIPETAARVAALTNGEVDLIVAVPPDQIDAINNSGKARIEGALYAGFYAYVVNVKVKPLDNKFIRQAISTAIDRKAIVEKLWRGRGAIPSGAYPLTDITGFDKSDPPLEYNPEKAKQLLKQAGYNNEEIFIEAPTNYIANDKPLTEALVSMLKNVGINAKADLMEFSVRQQRLRDKQVKGMMLGNPTSALFDPDGMIWRLSQPDAFYDLGRWNPDWDKLMTETRAITDEAKRNAGYKAANKMFVEDMPWIVVIEPEQLWGIGNAYTWKARPDELIRVVEIKIK